MAHQNYYEVEAESPVACASKLGHLFGSFIRDYLIEARKDPAWSAQLEEAEPLLAETAKHFPEYVKELEAYAAAAGIPLLELWAISIEDELGDDDDVPEKCTTMIANNGRLIAHNEDWDADAAEDIFILKKRCGDVTSLELYYYGCPLGGAALTISSRGHVQAINSLSHSDWQVGVPKLVMARALSEMRNADTDLKRLLSVRRSSGFAHNLVDRDGRVTIVEMTATRHSVRRPELPAVHTNHLTAPELQHLAGDPDGKSTFRRYDAACAAARSRMSEAEAQKLLSDDSRGPGSSVFNRNTIARAVVDLDRRTASFWLRRESRKGWVSYPVDFLFEAPQPVV